jgi:hypothetical protein
MACARQRRGHSSFHDLPQLRTARDMPDGLRAAGRNLLKLKAGVDCRAIFSKPAAVLADNRIGDDAITGLQRSLVFRNDLCEAEKTRVINRA